MRSGPAQLKLDTQELFSILTVPLVSGVVCGQFDDYDNLHAYDEITSTKLADGPGFAKNVAISKPRSPIDEHRNQAGGSNLRIHRFT